MQPNPLIQAIQGHQPERARELLDRDPSLAETRSEDGLSVLILALYHG